MKTKIFSLLLIIAVVLGSCDKDDTIPPDVYLYGNNGEFLADTDTDTTILLYTFFTDPGFKAEDNNTKEENLILSNDLEDILPTNDAGYVSRTGEYEITYSATDEANNIGSEKRKITVKNISDPFAGSYTTERSAQQIAETTEYTSTVSVDSRVPGRISFPKVYIHTQNDQSIYFKLLADLYNPELSNQYSENIAFMGKADDKDTPFFKDMTYSEATDEILEFSLLMIQAQTFTDALGNTYIISGVADPQNNDLPYSRIEYLGSSKTITKIILELNVTKEGDYTDRVTEIYTPQ